MSGQFADASYYLAMLNADDRWHQRAVEITRSLAGPLITTTWILTEVADALSRPQHRQRAVSLIHDMQADQSVEIIAPSMDLFNRGLALYSQRQDKAWSLTDCISFVVMNEYRVTEALTADRHFQQAGFVALMIESTQ